MFCLLIQMLALGVHSLHEKPANCSLRICVFLYRVICGQTCYLKKQNGKSCRVEHTVDGQGRKDDKVRPTSNHQSAPQHDRAMVLLCDEAPTM